MMTPEEIAFVRQVLDQMSPGPYCKGFMAGAIRHIVRNVDTDSFHDHRTADECLSPAKHDGDGIAVALTFLPKALDALTEAYAEIARLEALALTDDAFRCAMCQRVFDIDDCGTPGFVSDELFCQPCYDKLAEPSA